MAKSDTSKTRTRTRASKGKAPRSAVATSSEDAAAVAFDIEDPTLPDAIAEQALGSGSYPYDEKLKRKTMRNSWCLCRSSS